MSHILRPPSESAFSFADTVGGVPRCLLVLDSAVRRVLSDFWEEEARRRALDWTATLLTGCPDCGFRESSGLLRSLHSLLDLPAQSTVGIQLSLAERLLDLIGMLKDQARVSRN